MSLSAHTTTRATRQGLAEWGAPPADHRNAALVLGVATGVIILLAALLGLLAPALGVALFVLVSGALALFSVSRGSAALREVKAEEPAPREFARARNLIAGLAAEAGIPVPRMLVIQERGCNAMVTWRGGPVIAITEDLESELTRTECEAVLAHCVVRLASGEARSSTMLAGLGPFGPLGTEAAAADLSAVARTRYPPALSSAVGKATPRSGTFAALWFVPAAGGRASATARAAALEDL